MQKPAEKEHGSKTWEERDLYPDKKETQAVTNVEQPFGTISREEADALKERKTSNSRKERGAGYKLRVWAFAAVSETRNSETASRPIEPKKKEGA